MPGMPKVADEDEVVKHIELGVARRYCRPSWTPMSTPTKLTFTTAMMSSKVMSANGPPRPMPALL